MLAHGPGLVGVAAHDPEVVGGHRRHLDQGSDAPPVRGAHLDAQHLVVVDGVLVGGGQFPGGDFEVGADPRLEGVQAVDSRESDQVDVAVRAALADRELLATTGAIDEEDVLSCLDRGRAGIERLHPGQAADTVSRDHPA